VPEFCGVHAKTSSPTATARKWQLQPLQTKSMHSTASYPHPDIFDVYVLTGFYQNIGGQKAEKLCKMKS
jgi:hypothetical protein